jgi:hypothetical protein
MEVRPLWLSSSPPPLPPPLLLLLPLLLRSILSVSRLDAPL